MSTASPGGAAGAAAAAATMLRQFGAHLRKDFRLEWRSKDAINGMLFFALLVVVIFSFAFDPTAAQSRAIAGGIIWVALLFAAVLALNQAWMRETRHGVLDAIRMTPASPAMLFLAKAVANFLFVAALEAVLAPLFTVFYNLHQLGKRALLLLALPLFIALLLRSCLKTNVFHRVEWKGREYKV